MLSPRAHFCRVQGLALAIAFGLLVESPLAISADALEHGSGAFVDAAETGDEAAQHEAHGPHAEILGPDLRVERALDRINGHRGAAGLTLLRISDELSRAASRHTEEMARQSLMTHTSVDGMNPVERARAQGYRGRGVGEVLAMGFADGDQVVSAWMASPEHRKVLLGPKYGEVSITVAESASGSTFWTAALGIPTD